MVAITWKGTSRLSYLLYDMQVVGTSLAARNLHYGEGRSTYAKLHEIANAAEVSRRIVLR